MKKFCKDCGTPLKDGTKFCASCGTSVESPYNLVPSKQGATGAQTTPQSKNQVNISATPAAKAATVRVMEQPTEQTIAAMSFAGEMTFLQAMPLSAGLADIECGPGRLLFGNMKRFFSGFRETFHDKKKLVIVLTLSVIWIILNLLSQWGIHSLPVQILSFLTFAGGGMSGGVLEIAGGIAGKGIFAYFLVGIVLPLFSGRNPFKGMGIGVKHLFSVLSPKTGSLPALLMGVGVAWFIFNFLAGRAILPNSMVGIAAFFISLRSLGNSSGFLRSFIASLLVKKRAASADKITAVQSTMAGISVGFALSPLVTVISSIYPGYVYSGYILGLIGIVASVVLLTVTAGKKGEKYDDTE